MTKVKTLAVIEPPVFTDLFLDLHVAGGPEDRVHRSIQFGITKDGIVLYAHMFDAVPDPAVNVNYILPIPLFPYDLYERFRMASTYIHATSVCYGDIAISITPTTVADEHHANFNFSVHRPRSSNSNEPAVVCETSKARIRYVLLSLQNNMCMKSA